ncbi:MAG TPA: FHA domain-containing protein [Deltaproteobacteria bacterium]|nr:FHA domain-containing protein [Deltaproteobacteria bacterium]
MTMAGSDAQVIDSVEVVIKQPNQADRVVRLQEGATRLGRAEDNEVVLSDVGVSRRHAQVYVSRGEVTVEDLGSGNGTYYNGYRVQSQPVQDGDEIVIDPFILQFRIRGQEMALPPGGSPPGSAPARLEVVVGTGMAGSSYPIQSRGLSIGRSEDRDVVIPDPASSRHHCQIMVQGNEYVLRDMGSANGVFVNAVRVRECTLADGDLVRIGNTEMRFVRYDQPAQASTAQVPGSNMGGGWNEPYPSQVPPSMSQQGASPSVQSTQGGGAGRLIAILLASVLTLGALAVVTLIVVGIGVYFLSGPPTPIAVEAQPPRWELDLPQGLPAEEVPALTEQGMKNVMENNYRDALQDFYRILLASPGRHGVGTKAFSAGQLMVMDVLAEDFKVRAAERSEYEAKRDELLRQLGRSRTKERAKSKLITNHRDDPIVIERLGLKPSEERVKLDTMMADATFQVQAKSFGEAADLYSEVLSKATDPEMRAAAIQGLKTSRRQLAQQSSAAWTEAVMLKATGNKGEAKKKFKELIEAYPQLPSAQAHLEHY